MRVQAHTLGTQLGSQLHMVENFTVLHHGDLAVVADKGLVAAAQVDDGQAPVAQGYSAARLVVDAFVVRATVEQRLCHAAQGVIAQWLLLAIPVAKDAAHGGCSQFAPWPPRRRSVHQQIFRSSQSEASRV